MSDITQATARPWEVYPYEYPQGDGHNCVCVGTHGMAVAQVLTGSLGASTDQRDANARLIVTAVNCHDDLLEAVYITSMCSPVTQDLELMADDAEIKLTFTAADIRQIRAAIAKAQAGAGK